MAKWMNETLGRKTTFLIADVVRLVLLLALSLDCETLVSANLQPSATRDEELIEEIEGNRRLESTTEQQADGFLNGLFLHYNPPSTHTQTLQSTVHCVGENYDPDTAWMYRSCQYRNLCFDTIKKDFVIFPSETEKLLQEKLLQRRDAFVTISSVATNKTLALGAVNHPDWRERRQALKWFPAEANRERLSRGYYELPEDTILIPFHSFGARDARHLFWNDFLPIYTLLYIFGLEEKEILLVRYILQSMLPDTCDSDSIRSKECHDMFARFLPAMGVPTKTFSTNQDFVFQTSGEIEPKSNLICAKYGAAGLGMIADHVGVQRQNVKSTNTVGRGATLRAFRDYMMMALDRAGNLVAKTTSAYKLTFSWLTSSEDRNGLSFEKQIARIRQAFSEDEVVVQGIGAKELDVAEQARALAGSSIYITSCGEAAVLATFLQQGASLIVYCDDGEIEGGDLSERLCRNILSNTGYFRVHWLSLSSKDRETSLIALVDLVRSELNVIRRQ